MSMHLAMCETTAHAFFATSPPIHRSMSNRASNSLTASWALLYLWQHHCESTEQIQLRLNRSHPFEQLDSLRSYLCSLNSSLATVRHRWSLLFTQNPFQIQTFCSSHRWQTNSMSKDFWSQKMNFETWKLSASNSFEIDTWCETHFSDSSLMRTRLYRWNFEMNLSLDRWASSGFFGKNSPLPQSWRLQCSSKQRKYLCLTALSSTLREQYSIASDMKFRMYWSSTWSTSCMSDITRWPANIS